MMLTELNLSDGQITELNISSDLVVVTVEDWRNKSHKIVFKGVVGIEYYSPEGIDLCKMNISSKSENIIKVRAITESAEDHIIEYSFISAWNDLSVLNIFAEDAEIQE